MCIIACATPLKMMHIDGLSLADTTLVIQTHLIAIFLPSIITSSLIKSGYRISLIIIGLMIYLVAAYLAIGSHDVLQYWFLLLIIGFGWNFIYTASSEMLVRHYPPHAKTNANTLHDIIAGLGQGLGALTAGWLLINLHWTGITLLAFAVSLIWLACLSYLYLKINRLKNNEFN